MIAIGTNADGYREIIGCAEGFTESKDSWKEFLDWLKGRGLRGVRMLAGDKSLGMLGAIEEVFPQAKYQRCTVSFYRNVFSKVSKNKRAYVAKMLGAIHAQESFEASMRKAGEVAIELRSMKLIARRQDRRGRSRRNPDLYELPPAALDTDTHEQRH
jgi:transposase-like protein